MTSASSFNASPDMDAAKLIICMGVSGSGKSTVAEHLAARFDLTFIEADDFHPEVNIQHMKSGRPLTNEMRWPWIKALCNHIQNIETPAVMAFSGLNKDHRQAFRTLSRDCLFLHLDGDYEVILERMKNRNHFMPPALLQSQFDALDPTQAETDIMRVDIDAKLPEIFEQAEARTQAFLNL